MTNPLLSPPMKEGIMTGYKLHIMIAISVIIFIATTAAATASTTTTAIITIKYIKCLCIV